MASNLQCPSCLGVIKIENGFAVCDNCGVEVNLATHTATLTDRAPIWMIESYRMLSEIYTRKPMFVFGKQQLFAKDFKAKDCVAYTSSKYIGEDTPPFFIAFNGITSRFLRILLMNYINVGDDIEHLLMTAKPETLLSVWLMSSYPIKKEPLSFDNVRTLTALMAPTWIDCAESIFGNLPRDITLWTESELLYSYVTCNKLTLLTGVEYKNAMETLKEFVHTQSKFVHDQNDKLSYTEHDLERSGEVELMRLFLPDLLVANPDKIQKDNVAWLFGTNTKAVPIFDQDSSNFNSSTAIANGMNMLWTRYGCMNSRASVTLQHVKDASGVRDSYIKYWERMRERLR